MNTNQIICLGNPILRQTSVPVQNIHDVSIQTLIDDLIATTIAANGVGIAAPQIAISERLFIIASRPNPRYPHAPEMEPTAMINPKIIDYSPTTVKGWEGCLSVPGLRGFVPRSMTIQVEYTDRNGCQRYCQLSDFVARIFQHEYDHLEGIVFLDRVESASSIITEAEYQSLEIGGIKSNQDAKSV